MSVEDSRGTLSRKEGVARPFVDAEGAPPKTLPKRVEEA